jgi:type I restriction enzyme M protein
MPSLNTRKAKIKTDCVIKTSTILLSTFDKFMKKIKRYSHVATLEEIKENDFNLNIRRYADTSPPPEIFDVKAILNGGIPKYEVEDEYIQEVLDGFDVKKIFDDRDKDYYVFKESIESKEQIREVAGDVEAVTLKQIERWWEKYQTPLRQVEKDCQAATEKMNGFLVELGYE